jgi:hypothetical protein
MTVVLMVLICTLLVLNSFALLLNTSPPTRAAVGGMSYQELVGDRDFVRAVKTIAVECKVNADFFKVKC